MPLDHYVQQVHLKNFYSPSLNNRMLYAIKKSDLKSFPCRSQDICRIENGSTNAYLIHDRAIEEFLRNVEPKYNCSVAKLRENNIDKECIYVVAGFVAYVACCAPAAMRIHTTPLQVISEATAAILDNERLLPKAPEALGSKSLSELLADGTVYDDVDPKFPQALGINSIIERVSMIGNSKWEILHNEVVDSPFFTSDFPVAIEVTGHQRVLNYIVPLTPDLAIRIIPDDRLCGTTPDLSFARFISRRRTPPRSKILEINRLIVRCAEDMVFYRDNHEWIGKFVAKNRYYRIEVVTKRVPYAGGFLINSQQQIVSYQPNGQLRV
jgi:hypothetical protein